MTEKKTDTGASRREFLKSSAAVGAAAVGGLSLARSAHAAGKQEIRIGMIGCGGRCSRRGGPGPGPGQGRQAGRHDATSSRAACRPSATTSRAKFPDQFVATDATCTFGLDGYKAVIAASDAVLIACASKYHSFYAEEAVKAGKHVFVEKPHAIDPAGCRRLRRACELAKQKNLSLRLRPREPLRLAYQEQVKRIHDGAIGEVVAIQSMFLRGPYRTGRPRSQAQRDRVPVLQLVPLPLALGRRRDPVAGPQPRPHALGAARGEPHLVLRAGRPLDLVRRGLRRHVRPPHRGLRVQERRRGSTPCARPAPAATRTGTTSSWAPRASATGPPAASRARPSGATRARRTIADLAEQERLIGSIRSGKPINDGDTMIDSTYMAIMGQIACYTGKPVTWEQMMAADFEFEPKLADVRLDMTPPTKPDATGNYPLPMPGFTNYL